MSSFLPKNLTQSVISVPSSSSRSRTASSLKWFRFPWISILWGRSFRRIHCCADEVGGEQILWAASERAGQLFDKVNARSQILRYHSLDLRKSSAGVFG